MPRPRLSIPRRIFLGFSLVLTLSGLVSVASFVQHQRTAGTLSLVHEGYLPLALTVSEARATQSVFGNLLDRVLSERNPNATRTWLTTARKARPGTLDRALDGIAKIEEMAPQAADRTTLARLRRELRRVKAMVATGEERYQDLYAALDSPDKADAERVLVDLRARERNIDGRLRSVWASVLGRIEATSERAAAEQESALGVLFVLVLASLFVGVLVTIWAQRVLAPLPRLQERVEAVARGDFAHRLGPNTDDEIGRLGREFERMVAAVAARDASLQSLQQMQAQILSDLRAAVLVVDGDGVLRSSNPAASSLFDLSASALQRPLGESALLERIEGLSPAIESAAMGKERAVLAEARFSSRLASEPERRLNVVVTPFGPRPVDGGHGQVLIVAEDVTEELRTKARLIQTERLAAIGRMAAHVTHEVRNPLSSIGLNVELLEEELAAAGVQVGDLLTAIHREIEHLTAITEEYLRVARLPTPRLEPEDIGDVTRATIEFLRPELRAAKVEVELTVDEALPLVAIDEPQIRQVLVNLLKNAREAMADGGAVKVEARRAGDGVSLRVVDQGTGMSEEQRARIFDLFYTTKKHGSGLGLPLSQQIVIAHKGMIRCESTPGQGTSFELWFPAFIGERRLSERVKPEPPRSDPQAGKSLASNESMEIIK